MSKILIVEDEDSIRDLICMILKMEKYEVFEADNGEKALELIFKEHFDLILLDIMIPKINGLEILQKINYLNIPVIFLTAKTSLQDKILGLKLGAEDYITKPFEPLELLARVDVILRRKLKGTNDTKEKENILKFKNITIYELERRVTVENKEVHLTVKEYNLLIKFLNNKNIILTREKLLNSLWGYDFVGDTRTIDMHVKQLREKLNLKEYLETVYKVGYKLKE